MLVSPMLSHKHRDRHQQGGPGHQPHASYEHHQQGHGHRPQLRDTPAQRREDGRHREGHKDKQQGEGAEHQPHASYEHHQ